MKLKMAIASVIMFGIAPSGSGIENVAPPGIAPRISFILLRTSKILPISPRIMLINMFGIFVTIYMTAFCMSSSYCMILVGSFGGFMFLKAPAAALAYYSASAFCLSAISLAAAAASSPV
jgi:hypothetical protein